MGQQPSKSPPSPKRNEVDMGEYNPRIIEKRYVNELVAYSTIVRCDDGSSRHGLYFLEWHVVFFVYSGKLCIKHMIYNDIKSKKVIINREDATKFQTAYQAYNESCIKLEGITNVYKQYVKDSDIKL